MVAQRCYVSAMTTDWEKLMLFDFTPKSGRNWSRAGITWHYGLYDERYYYFMNEASNTVERVRISDHKVEPVMRL